MAKRRVPAVRRHHPPGPLGFSSCRRLSPPPRWSQIHARTSSTDSARPRSVSTMGRPPGSRSAAACRALGDNVLTAPRKRERAVVRRLRTHLAPTCSVVPAVAAAAATCPATPVVPCFLPSHPPLSPSCADAAHLVLPSRAPRTSSVSRPAPALPSLGPHVAGLCPGACTGSALSHPSRPPGGFSYLLATVSYLLIRHTSPCTRAAPGLLHPISPPRHAPR